MQYENKIIRLFVDKVNNKTIKLSVRAQVVKDDTDFITMAVELPDKTIITFILEDILLLAKKVGV